MLLLILLWYLSYFSPKCELKFSILIFLVMAPPSKIGLGLRGHISIQYGVWRCLTNVHSHFSDLDSAYIIIDQALGFVKRSCAVDDSVIAEGFRYFLTQTDSRACTSSK